jgi:hypothetical protein
VLGDRSETPSIESGPSVPPEGRSELVARRRLLRGGLGVAPVLMTVASRPVMAGMCESASAHTSLSGSRVATLAAACSGRLPAYWISRATSGYLMDTSGGGSSGLNVITFGSVFGLTGDYDDKTLLKVLEGHLSTGDEVLAAYLVAALLNAKEGWTPESVLDEERVKEIWSDYSKNMHFEPTAGVEWDSVQIVDWLKTTMPNG